MTNVYYDSELGDGARRERLYLGDIFVYSPTAATKALAKHARQTIEAAFAPHDPRKVQDKMPVEQCVEILSRVKPQFIHHPKCKEMIPAALGELGCDLEKTYFDVPRLRSAMPQDYLTAGIAYAFHPHRDTWYSAPFFQLNWWLPVYELSPQNCLAFHPRYFTTPVRNGSAGYNYYRWNADNRASAAQHVKADTRVQPKAEEPMELDPQIRIIAPPGSVILFCGAQMHSTVPNTSGLCRYSVDFRTVNLDDAVNRRGAANVDTACTGTTMRDYLCASDLSRIPDHIVAMYDDGTEGEGLLVYSPNEVKSSATAKSG
jgi:hypothetical protein